MTREDAILATNTSSFELSNLHEASGRPQQLVGLHFFNPVQIMKLIEVVRTDKTDDKVFDTAVQFAKVRGDVYLYATSLPVIHPVLCRV